MEGSDSGGGIAAVDIREIDIGAVSRAPKPGELGEGMAYQPFAHDAAAFVGDGGVPSLTRSQLKDVFSGKLRNWREVGGRDLPTVVLVRDEDESITQLLRAELFGERFRFTRRATVLNSASDMNEALQRTPGAIGFTSYGSFTSERMPLNSLEVGGIAPSVAAIERGSYPYVRDLGVVVRPGRRETAFNRFLAGDAVSERLRELGYAPAA